MQKILVILIALGCVAALRADDAALSPTAATEALALTPAAAAELAPPLLSAAATTWDLVELKNGEHLECTILGYDAYFLELETKDAKKQNLPWKDVVSLRPAASSWDLAAMQKFLTPADAEAKVAPTRLDPDYALQRALWPGFLIHGSGYRAIGDQDTFLSMAGAEIFSVLVGGFGLAKVLGPGVTQNDRDTASYLVWGGAAGFTLTWVWDLLGSPAAARRSNRDNGFTFKPLPGGGAALAFRREF